MAVNSSQLMPVKLVGPWFEPRSRSQNTLVNQALTRNRGGLFLRLDWGIRKPLVLHWFG